MSSILVFPGTQWQISLVKSIKNQGHYVIVVGPEENPPCKEYADRFYKKDIFDIDGIELISKKEKVNAILSDECDIAIPIVAELSKRLCLDSISCEEAALYTNKYLMRSFCAENGFSYPDFIKTDDVEEAIQFLNDHNGEAVVKPIDSNASHGVFVVNSADEMIERFNESMLFSRIEKKVLVERRLNGTEFTVDGIKTKDAHYSLAISEKKHFDHNPTIANELLFTYSNHEYDYGRLRELNDRFVLKTGLKWGLTHAEYICENGEYYLVEIGARGGGNHISDLIVPFLSGYDTYDHLINCALGKAVKKGYRIDSAYYDRAAVLKFFKTPRSGGIVTRVDGLNCLVDEKDVVDYHFNFRVGDRIEVEKNDSVRIGYYIACSDNEEKLKRVMDRIDREFNIEVRDEY